MQQVKIDVDDFKFIQEKKQSIHQL